MRLYKLIVTGTDVSDFKVEYTYSDNYVTYSPFDFKGNEQERYEQYLEDLKAHNGTNPILIKVKMKKMGTDRAFARNVIFECKKVEDFIERLGK